MREKASDRLPGTSVFASLESASRFFAAGSLGSSATSSGVRLDGLELRTSAWNIAALDVGSVTSNFYAKPSRFPPGSVEFDSAMVMRDLPHEWHPVPSPTALPARA